MAKSKSKASATTTTNTTSSPPPNLTTSLPSLILTSKALEPTTLIESQVTLLPNLLSKKECNSLIDHFSSSTYQLVPSPAPKKGEALRTNSRIGFQDPAFAKRLWNELGMKGIVEGWESLDGKAKGKGKKPVGLNGNIRIYRYLENEVFGPHYDESSRDESTGHFSEWTLLVYLTGQEDGVEGGETAFYENHSTKNAAILAPLEKGMGLLHRHGQACMLHEGRPPTKGVKWILRSDLLFG